MRTIPFWLFTFAFAAFTSGIARAQDAATQQQIDQINGRIENLIDMQAAHGKQLAGAGKERQRFAGQAEPARREQQRERG